MSENDDSYTTNSRVLSGRPAALGIATALLTTANGIAAITATLGSKPRSPAKISANATSDGEEPGERGGGCGHDERPALACHREVERPFEDDEDEADGADHGNDRLDPVEVPAERVEDLPRDEARDDEQHHARDAEVTAEVLDPVGQQQEPGGGEDGRVGHACIVPDRRA